MPYMACCFHCPTIVWWMPCFAACCAVVSSPRSASSATRALNSAEYRVRFPAIGSVLFTGRTKLIHLSEFPGPAHFFLPAYSPDLNPIEMVFAKLKTLLRKSDERSVEATWRRIGDLLSAFSDEECAAYLRHAGYVST
jgi:hypothetical protein